MKNSLIIVFMVSLKSIEMIKTGKNCLNNHMYIVVSKTLFGFIVMDIWTGIVFISQLVMTSFEDFLVPTRNI
jgi:hypothetical protein